MSDTVLVFANPIAGRGMGKSIAERVAARLMRDGFDPRLVFDRCDLVPRDRLVEHARAAIAIGGAGTVRGVARRLFELYGDRMPPRLVIPMGTANLLGRHLGTWWKDSEMPVRASETIRARKILHLDAARANGELFLLMAGVGLD